MSKKGLYTLTLQEKVAVIQRKELNSKLSCRDLAKEFKCGHSQIGNILKRKEAILKEQEANRCGQRRRLQKTTTNDEINRLTYEWFCKARSKNIPISGPILQQQARKFADALGVTDFIASNGWLQSFRKRNGINFNILSGEGKSVDHNVVGAWKDSVASACHGYEMQDIFNMDETGLFWRALPSKSLTNKNEDCKGGKQSKERLTVVLCVNATGTEKKKLLVVGKYANPRAFKNWSESKRPIFYRYNKNSWMTGEYFKSWLMHWDERLKKSGRKILLFLDNASVHPFIDLEHIKLKYFPPNTTSHTQPLDQGIIKNFKVHYRKRVIERALCLIEDVSASEIFKQMNIRDACIWMAEAWHEVSAQTVANCFKKAGFPLDSTESNQPESIEETDKERLPTSLDTFADMDRNLCTFEAVDDNFGDQMYNMVANNQAEVNGEDEDEDEDEDEIEEIHEKTTVAGAIQAMQYLKHFALNQNESDFYDKLESAQRILDKLSLDSKQKKQTLVTDYFKKQ